MAHDFLKACFVCMDSRKNFKLLVAIVGIIVITSDVNKSNRSLIAVNVLLQAIDSRLRLGSLVFISW